MVISFSTCQKEEKECTWVKYLIYAICHDLKFVVIYAFSLRKICISKISEFIIKCFFPSLQIGRTATTIRQERYLFGVAHFMILNMPTCIFSLRKHTYLNKLFNRCDFFLCIVYIIFKKSLTSCLQ